MIPGIKPGIIFYTVPGVKNNELHDKKAYNST